MQITFHRDDQYVLSRSHTSCQAPAPLLDINVASISTWSGEKTKIALHVLTVMMTYIGEASLLKGHLFLYKTHMGEGNCNRINWTFKVILTLLYF